MPCGNVYICGVEASASTPLERPLPRSGTKLRVPEFRNALARSGIIVHSKRHVETHPFTPRKAITLLANVIIDNANVDKIICLLNLLYYYYNTNL